MATTRHNVAATLRNAHRTAHRLPDTKDSLFWAYTVGQSAAHARRLTEHLPTNEKPRTEEQVEAVIKHIIITHL